MKRFDVYTLKGNSSVLIVNIQADLFNDLATRIIIPLIPLSKNKKEAIEKLKPIITLKNKGYILATTDISAITKNSFDKFVVNIEDDYRDIITESVDFALQGF